MSSPRCWLLAAGLAFSLGCSPPGNRAAAAADPSSTPGGGRGAELAAEPAPAVAGAAAGAAPVLVELFTSEGCSSCPSADKLLARLSAEQPVAGAEIVLLAFHVDYWNDLGWKDPFSSPSFTGRQRDYATHAGQSGVYTPQAVVDGSEEFVGSDEGRARRAIVAAARAPKVRLAIERRSAPGAALALEVRVPGGAPGQVSLALVEDGIVVAVPAGENAGSKLSHTAVVRWFKGVGQAPGEGGVFPAEVPLGAGWRPERLRAVAFVQDPATRAVRGVGVLAAIGAR
jgi:hypothetical protein